jgi:hypothetical protein
MTFAYIWVSFSWAFIFDFFSFSPFFDLMTIAWGFDLVEPHVGLGVYLGIFLGRVGSSRAKKKPDT